MCQSSKKAKLRYIEYQQETMAMRKFITEDDHMARHLKQTGGDGITMHVQHITNRASYCDAFDCNSFDSASVRLGNGECCKQNDELSPFCRMSVALVAV